MADALNNQNISITVNRIPAIRTGAILHVSGIIDTYNSTFFQTQVLRLIELNYIHLVFDCSNLTYISSTGIGSFTLFLRTIKEKGGKFVIVGLQSKVYDVFELLGFNGLFFFYNTIEDGIKALTAKSVNTVNTTELFPKLISCKICNKRLRVLKPGKYRCPVCKGILAV